MKKPPLPLIAIALIYLASEILVLISQPKTMGFVRITIYAAVLLFALKGNQTAAKIWGVMSVFGGVVSGFGAIQMFQSNADGSLLLALYSAFFFMSACYVFFSPSLRNYYQSTSVDTDDR